jgi:predicted HicB family RNase H-like nuclease
MQIRIQPRLKEQLVLEAERRMLSANLLAERAIEEALARWRNDDLVTSAR